MKKGLPILEDIQIASPCSASWDDMEGDDLQRHCGSCKLDVFNLSGMTTKAAKQLVAERTGRMCVRFFRRFDGTVLTQDCPSAAARVRRRIGAVAAVVFGLIGMSGAAAAASALANTGHGGGIFASPTLSAIASLFTGGPLPLVTQGRMVMGGMPAPPTPPTSPLRNMAPQPTPAGNVSSTYNGSTP